MPSSTAKSGKNLDSTAKRSGAKNEIQGKITDGSRDSLQLAELIESGDHFRKSGKYEDARVAYRGALAISPDNPDVHHRLAIIADKQQQYSVADQHYQAALRARPRDVNLLSDLGYSYSLRGNAQQAEQTLKQALSIDPTHRGAMANLGSIYAQQNRQSEALAIFRKGCASEAEAQQSVSKIFARSKGSAQLHASLPVPQNGEKGDNQPRSDSEFATAQSDPSTNLSQLSVQQLQAELARRAPAGKSARTREKSWDDPEAESDKSDQPLSRTQKTASADVEVSSSKSASSRGKSDSEVMQARGQTSDDTTDVLQTSSTTMGATQLATRIGMNAGPGTLFPLLGGGNDGTGGASSPVNAAPKPPVTSSSANWRDQLQNSVTSSWDSDVQNDSSSKGPFDTGQSSMIRTDQTKSPRKDSTSLLGPKSQGENTRPYKGQWPKTGDNSSRQSSSAGNGRTFDGFDEFSANLIDGRSTGNGSVSKQMNNSPVQWPDAPNR